MAITLPDGMLGYGFTIGYSSDGSSYSTLVDVQDADHEGDKTDAADITTNSSTNARRAFTAGLNDPGTFKFKVLYTYANLVILNALYRLTKSWKATFPDTHTAVFLGFIAEKPVVMHMADPATIDVTVKISGDITYG